MVAKVFNEGSLRDRVLFNIPDYLRYLEIGKVAISDDGNIWATYPKDGYVVYVGDFTGTKLNVMYQYKNTTVRDLTFRPGTYELIISVGDWSKNYSSLSGFEIIHNTNYGLQIADKDGIIMKVSYASTNVFYALEEQHSGQGSIKKYIKRYNHVTKEVLSYEPPFDVIDIECRG